MGARLQNFEPPSSTEPATWAYAYAAVGMAIFPCGANKRPLTLHGFKDATTDEETITAWWRSCPFADAAWAIPADIVVLDLDGVGGLKSFAAAEGRDADSIETPQATTPRGGLHLIYSANGAEYRNSARANGKGIDTRTIGGYIALPSPGNGRAWIKPLSTPLAPAPPWVKPAAQQGIAPMAVARETAIASPFARYAVDTSLRAIARYVARAPEGERNCITFWAACRFAEYARAGLLDEAWAAELLALAATRAGLPADEARRTIKSGFGKAD